MKMGSSKKPDELFISGDDECGAIDVDFGIHRVSSRVEADGSAEAVLSNTTSSSLFAAAPPMTRTMSTPLGGPVPMSRTKSTPLGGVSYAMRRVLSRDDRGRPAAAVSEQETEGLVNSRVKGVYKRGGVETVLDENSSLHSSPPQLVKTKSLLSPAYAVRKVFSKRDGEWQSALENNEADDLMSSRVGDAHDDQFEENDTSLKGGYGLRQVNSTPLQGMEDGYALKRSKTSGYEQQSSLFYEEEKGHNPISLVRSRLSSIGQKVTGGGGGKELGKGKDDTANDDDLSTIAESIESSPTAVSDFEQKNKKMRSKKFYQIIFAAMMIASGVAGAGMYLLKANSNNNFDTSNVVIAGEKGKGYDVDSLKTPEAIPDEGIVEDEVIIVDDSNELSEVDESSSSAVDAKPDLESIESIFTNSTDHGDSDGEETVETIAADEDQSIPTTIIPATTPPPQPDTITTFYVMADAPYTDNERQNLMPKHIEELDDDVEFLVHLGDLQWAKVDKCREGAYDEASTIMKKSRIPTFILPGDNDINDCNSISHGEEMWTKYFALFDKQYDHSFDVSRWGKLDESFSFVHKRILFLGLNIIGGKPASSSETSDRHSQHLQRIRTIMNDQLDDFNVVVLLGHAEPTSYHDDFFGGDSGFLSMIKDMGKPTIHFHGDWHAYYEREAEYGVDNYMRISLDGESVAPPIQVTIDTSKENPVKFDRRSNNLEVACCSEGWPRYDGKVVSTPRPN
jgi:hypothetical protein